MSTPVTVGDLSMIKGQEGIRNVLVLNPDTHKVNITAILNGYDPRVFYTRDMVLAEVPEGNTEAQLREWIQANMAAIQTVADGYLGSGWDRSNNRVGNWSRAAALAAYNLYSNGPR